MNENNEKRFEIVIVTVDNTKEISILDTEEDNVQLFYCECEEENLFFIKQEVEQVVRMLNFQNDWINYLIEKNKKLKEKIDEQDRRMEGLEHQVFCGYDLY